MKWWEVPEFRPFKEEWRTSAVKGLLQNPDETSPILADALQDAGCEDQFLLDTLRGNNRAAISVAYLHIVQGGIPAPFYITDSEIQTFVEEILVVPLTKIKGVRNVTAVGNRHGIDVLVYWEIVREYRLDRGALEQIRDGTDGVTRRQVSFNYDEMYRYSRRRKEYASILHGACSELYRAFVEESGVDLNFLRG